MVFFLLFISAYPYGSLSRTPAVLVKGSVCNVKEAKFKLIRSRKDLDKLCDKVGISIIKEKVFEKNGKKFQVLAAFSGSSKSEFNWPELETRWHSLTPADLIVNCKKRQPVEKNGKFSPFIFYLIHGNEAEQETILINEKADDEKIGREKLIKVQRASILRCYNAVDNFRPELVKEWRLDKKTLDSLIKWEKEYYKYNLEIFLYQVHNKKIRPLKLLNLEQIEEIIIRKDNKSKPLSKEDIKKIIALGKGVKSHLYDTFLLRPTEERICEIILKGKSFQETFELHHVDLIYRNLKAKMLAFSPINKGLKRAKFCFRSYEGEDVGNTAFGIINQYLKEIKQ